MMMTVGLPANHRQPKLIRHRGRRRLGRNDIWWNGVSLMRIVRGVESHINHR